MDDVSPAPKASVSFTARGIARGGQRLLPLSVFVFPFGVAYGVAAIETGLTADQALIMSLIVFAGAAQFAVLDLWQSPLPFVSMALVMFAVNARHFILGAAISPYVNPLPARHWFWSLVLLTDLNFADTYKSVNEGRRDLGQLFGGGLALWAVWALATAVGVFAGALLGELERYGVDVVMAGAFAALSVGMIPNLRAAVPVAVACVVAVITLPVLPTGWNIIAAALAGGAAGLVFPAQPKQVP
ncbi:MAG: AzlC family ABC transporter permease [Devosiaceae bacterium]|nr:AzlC family ABC transporter permease [Devosiaceae bacterium MH13]